MAESNFLQPDFDEERPDESAVAKYWQSASLELVSTAVPTGTERFFFEWGNLLANGRIGFASFKVPADRTLAWFASRNRLGECGFFDETTRRILEFDAIPGLGLNARLPIEWKPVDSLILDGRLAQLLVWGGPYRSFLGRERDAKMIGGEAARALLDDNLGTAVEIVEAYEAWSDWFFDVAWDQTLLVFSKHSLTLSIAVGTDTD